jgi:hypothetical protein
MSFIYNEDLISEFEIILNKIAQAQPMQNTDPKQLQSLVLSLLNNLKQGYSRVQTEGAAPLSAESMQSLDSFILWLKNNKVKFDGRQVVASPNEVQQVKDIKYSRYPEAPAGSPPPASTTQYAVYSEGLLGILQDLRKQAAASGNKVFSEHVANVINEAANAPGLKLDLEEKEPQQQAQNTEVKQETNQQPNQQQSQTSQQGQAGQNPEYQQVSQNVQAIQQVSQQTVGTPIPILPFDLTTNQFDLGLIRKFTTLMDALLDQQFMIQELRSYLSGLNAAIGQLGNSLSSWRSLGATMDSFPLDGDVEGFTTDVANKDYGKARDMLVLVGTICRTTNSILSTMLASPSFVGAFEKQRIDAQRQKALNFATWSASMLQKINIMAKR